MNSVVRQLWEQNTDIVMVDTGCASDRDAWKLAHWDEYIATQNFKQPDNIPEIGRASCRERV